SLPACFVFFFQAEDGIRDFHVTGVQTCALPISVRLLTADGPVVPADQSPADRTALITTATRTASSRITSRTGPSSSTSTIRTARSEERRVGKEWRSRGEPNQYDKQRATMRQRSP